MKKELDKAGSNDDEGRRDKMMGKGKETVKIKMGRLGRSRRQEKCEMKDKTWELWENGRRRNKREGGRRMGGDEGKLKINKKINYHRDLKRKK